MSDQQITCSECGGVFVFTEAEQQFYETKGLAAPPKRCKACRQARRAAREGGAGPDNARGAGGGFGGGGGGGGFGGGAPRGGGGAGGGGGFGGRPGAAPRRFSNDANEYRAPMNGGPSDRGPGGPPRAGGFNARGPRPARPGFSPNPSQGGAGFRGGNADARPTFNRPDERPRGNFNGPAQGNASGQGGQGEYRGPARDRGQWGTNGGPGQGAGASRGPAGNGGNDRPRRPERDFNAPRPERVVTPPSDDPRQTRPRAERPRFDITCAECGTQSQVPFKPLEGRQVFCQACYRARKGPSAAEAGAVETNEAPETDLGIVE